MGAPRGWMSTSDYNEACRSRSSSPKPRRELTEEELLKREEQRQKDIELDIRRRLEEKKKREKFEAERPLREKEGYDEVMAVIREFGTKNNKIVNLPAIWVSNIERGRTGAKFTKELSHGFKVYGTWDKVQGGYSLKITHYLIFKDGKRLERKWKLQLLTET